jgi:WD40 repeat protein
MRHARAWTDRRDRISAGEAVDDASPSPPEAPACCRMWTDREIEAEDRRIREAPTRRDRLTAFASFVQRESHALVRFGTREAFVVQHAFNDAAGGPVHDAASGMVPHARAPLLLRRWPGTTWKPHPAILRTLTGHTDAVSSVSVSADGMRAISSSADTSLRVWDLATGACVRTLSTRRSQETVCTTADGQRALSTGSIDGEGKSALELWDLESGSCIRTLDGHSAMGFSEVVAGMTADGRRALSASNRDATMVVWDLERGVRARLLEGHTKGVTAISMTPDGRRAISAGNDDTLRIWDVDDGRCLRSLQASRVTSVSLTADGRRAISASLDHTLQVWDVDNGQLVRVLTGHAEGVASVTATADGRRAISGGLDRTLRVWDVETGVCLRILEGYDERALAVTADGKRAVTSAAGNTLRVWDLERGASPDGLERHTAAITDVSIGLDGRRAVSASTDGTLRVWDLDAATSLRRLDGHDGRVHSASVTADGTRAVSSSADDTLRVWDLESGTALRVLPGFRASYERVRSVTPDGRYAVSAGMDAQASADGRPRIWDLGSGTAMPVLRRPVWPLCVWNLEQGTCIRTLEAHAGPVTSVSMSADGRRALSGSWDETVRLWDLETGACLRTLRGHTGWITGVSLMDQSRRAITASHDQTVRVWNLESGACLFTLHSHRTKVTSVTALADGLRAVSVGDDGELRVWDIKSGERLRSFKGHGSGSFELNVTETGLCVCMTRLARDRTLWVQSLETGDEAVLSISDPVSAFAVASGVLVAGTSHGDIQVFEAKNFAPEAVTAKAGEADHEQLLRRRVETARQGNDREAYFGYLTDLGMYLEDIGRAEEALALAREGEIAVSEYLLGLQWANPDVALEQYKWAVYLRSTGRPEESEPHLRRVLEIERQVLPPDSPLLPHHMNELCTVLVMQGLLPESASLAADAWNLQQGRHDMTSARILLVRLAIAILESQPTGLYIGLLKTLLAGPDLNVPPGITRFWDIKSFLDDVGAKVTRPEKELLTAIESTLNSPPEPVVSVYRPDGTLETVLDSRRPVSQLDRHEAWTVQPAVPLDAPWTSRRPVRDSGV